MSDSSLTKEQIHAIARQVGAELGEGWTYDEQAGREHKAMNKKKSRIPPPRPRHYED